MSITAASKLSLNDGYHYYKAVLKSPKYVVAPMVSQSELAWRMLARKHGAQLCYTPMVSAHTLLRDKNYRKEVLQDLSCAEDRPLIVQFCANTVDTFVSAAEVVQNYCDGVDLNLGCPQHIAKRGQFGAYLQDDWELLHDIISESRKRLNIGVSAKIRVFPEVSRTIDYAKMLEKAGCQLLTVHGRTRDQRKVTTGLADWTQIKAVKDNLSVPVFANGNIQYGADIDRCLEETGVDGVMVAEGHLTNPMIFEGLQPNVFEVIDEYLSFVELYPAPMSFVRTHVFTLLSHTFQRHKSMMNMLANTSMMKILVTVVERLKKVCDEDSVEESIVPSSGLPYWLCQPYNKFEHARLKIEEKREQNPSIDEQGLTKNEQKRQRIFHYQLMGRRKRRLQEHQRRKERIREANNKLEGDDMILKSRVLRNLERKQAMTEKLEAAMHDDDNNLVVCLDLSWSQSMSAKEINKLSSQLGRLYGSNRNSEKPAHIYFTNFEKSSLLWQECIRKHNGFESYKIDMTSKPFSEMFTSKNIVYLTPDSPTALESVEPGTVYILGGLVDETVTKKLTLNVADESGIITRRLPVHEYMKRSGKHSNYSTVYCVNQVFDILLTYHATQDWRRALTAGVPLRKGYVLNEDHE